MIILSATVRIMKNICDIFMKTLYGGITTNYTPKNRGMALPLQYKCETGDQIIMEL